MFTTLYYIEIYSLLYALVGSLDTLPIHSLHLTIIGAYTVILMVWRVSLHRICPVFKAIWSLPK